MRHLLEEIKETVVQPLGKRIPGRGQSPEQMDTCQNRYGDQRGWCRLREEVSLIGNGFSDQ